LALIWTTTLLRQWAKASRSVKQEIAAQRMARTARVQF
jgi:hypothetical protein